MSGFFKRYFPVALIGIYFLKLAKRGLAEDFNSDDAMNLGVAFYRPLGTIVHGALAFWSGYIRPLGALFYLVIYSYAGYWSRPFRVACFTLIIFNLGLAYRVFLLLFGSRAFASLALLTICFQPSMGDIYMSTGTVYDLLCQTFILAALNLCIGQELSAWRLAGVAFCTVAAVDAKEVGVAIPALLLAYELVFRPRKRAGLAAVAVSGAIVAVFLFSRLFVKNELTNHDSYQVTLTLHQYLVTTRNYINQIVAPEQLSEAAAFAVLLPPLAAAALLRSRPILFGWLYYVLALAPMSFAPPRTGYALYIPYTGVGILAAALAFELGNRLRARRAVAAVFATCVIPMQVQQDRTWVRAKQRPAGQEPIRTLAGGMAARYPSLPKGSRLLLVNDPFGDETFTPEFVLWIRYHDPTLQIAKATWKKGSGRFAFPAEPYDHTLLFTGSKTWELTQQGIHGADDAMDGRPLAYAAMNSDESDLNVVQDVGGLSPGDRQRWMNQDPVLSFRVPKQPAVFRMEYDLPPVILKATGPLRVAGWIAELPLPAFTLSEPGAHRYEVPLPAGIRTGDVVNVRFHVENPYIATGDNARLSLLLTSAGFVTR